MKLFWLKNSKIANILNAKHRNDKHCLEKSKKNWHAFTFIILKVIFVNYCNFLQIGKAFRQGYRPLAKNQCIYQIFEGSMFLNEKFNF